MTGSRSVLRFGVTAGCGAGFYCRNAPTTRAQMAVFLLKAKLGPTYTPPPPTRHVFSDVPADGFAAAWIEDLAPAGSPAAAAAATSARTIPSRGRRWPPCLKDLVGPLYVPPAATGTVFDDVPADASPPTGSRTCPARDHRRLRRSASALLPGRPDTRGARWRSSSRGRFSFPETRRKLRRSRVRRRKLRPDPNRIAVAIAR